MPIRILVVDDEHLTRRGLVTSLSAAPDLEVVAEAEDGAQAIELPRRHHPDVVFMDLQMPGLDGTAATREIRRLPRPPAVVVLTQMRADETCLLALEAGACSFIVKASPNEDLIRAARTALSDEPFFSPAAARVMRAALPAPADPRAAESFATLTARERQIAHELRAGTSNRDIARVLSISEGTVKSHIKIGRAPGR